MYLLPLYFTMISFCICIFFGRFFNNYYAGFLTSILLLLSFLCALFIFYEVVLNKTPVYIDCGSWISVVLLEVRWAFMFDSVTSVMLIVILGVSMCAHFYSIEYMLSDPHQVKFMSYLSLFTMFMLLLVTANNFLILFLGWEGVGICSYLLINFWFTRLGANKSAIMAVFVNKIGDISILIALTLIFLIFYTYDFNILFFAVHVTMYTDVAELDFYLTYILYIVCFFFIIGAVGKSAQLGLHMWLPEAMEGPTPVSSLIHAATMVTAGIFLVIKSNLFFQWCNDLSIIIIAIGSLTAFVGSTIGIFQFDIKKIVAYSTCSQLGYMFLACGLNGYSFSLFHLTNHAFFKALLFLTAGYIIHAINNEQDIRRLGGLYKILPFSYIGINIGSLSLLGFPFTSGFFSKEKIIELFYNVHYFEYKDINSIHLLYFFSLFGNISVMFTLLYSVKVLVYVFFYLFQNSYKNLVNIHYSSYITLIPLFTLSMLSIVSGYYLEDLMVGISTSAWNATIFFQPLDTALFNLNLFELNILSSKLPIFAIFYFLVLFIIFYVNFIRKLYAIKISNSSFEYIFQFLNKKYIFLNKNIFYILIEKLFSFSYTSMYLLFDKGIIEILGPYGVILQVKKIIYKTQNMYSGMVYHYSGILIISIFLLCLNYYI